MPERNAHQASRGRRAVLSDTTYSLISLRKSTPTQNRQLKILISNSKQLFDDFVGELTFQNHLIHQLIHCVRSGSWTKMQNWTVKAKIGLRTRRLESAEIFLRTAYEALFAQS